MEIETTSQPDWTVGTIEKRSELLETRISNQVREAKAKAAKGDRGGALQALKRKKLYDNEVRKLSGARTTLDQQILALESLTVDKLLFQSMADGVQAMKCCRKVGNELCDSSRGVCGNLK